MDHRPVAPVPQRAQHGAFGRPGIQQRQRLIGVAGEDHPVEALGRAARGDHAHAVRAPLHALDGVSDAAATPETTREGVDISARAALDHPPPGPVAQPKQAMVGHEDCDMGDGQLAGAGQRHRPQGGAHRQQVVVDERAGIAALVQELAQGARVFGGDLRRVAVEAADAAQHRQERRADQVAAVAEQRAQPRGAVLDDGAVLPVAPHGERHVGGPGGHSQLVQPRREQRIVGPVEDDETRVHRVAASVRHQVVGIGVAAEARLGLEQADLRELLQGVGRSHARDTPTHDGYPHRPPSPETVFRSRTRPTDAIRRSTA